ncbi:hypothetical protein [Gordonia rubripertincta]|uniref:Uncharacterized protein n=1 Tax=Gordonia rubripertincta TaxID=36822 RepID=A0ABT4N321_GORRU|nr:hypothetical protein [Gordonia rubripertincta]MCZ4553656.1 hypothetical protein [Gordonia rubripertincta]
MAAIIVVAAALAVAAMLLWGIGSTIARVAGIILLIDGLGGIALHANALAGTHYVTEAVIGLGLWLTGHWLYALKHRLWRSHLAMVTWRLPVLTWLAPIPTR